MPIFMGNCNRYQASQINIFITIPDWIMFLDITLIKLVIFLIDFLYLIWMFPRMTTFDKNIWAIDSRSSPTFVLVLGISKNLLIMKI